jgi:acyl-CoA thioesterase
MKFGELLTSAGGFKGLFELAKKNGLSPEKELETFLREESGLFALAGFSVEKLEDGYAELSFPYSHEVARHGGILHGGIITFALDNVGGCAVMTQNRGVDQVTLELKVNFLEPARESPFRAIGKVLREGRTISTAEAELRDRNGKLCAKGIATYFMISRSAKAE